MITRLDASSSRQISAGQVITDLSSVLKELLENAIDAGARLITVRLHNFGIDKIVVEDDGSGIPMPGVVTAVGGEGTLMEGASTSLLGYRATTKQRSTESWSSAGSSLGFRGEALHSLAQVGAVAVETMHTSHAPYTVRVTYDAVVHKVNLMVTDTRQTTGSTVTVDRLFESLPVRHKEWVKNRRKQLLRATSIAKQYAVSHPELRLVLTHQESPQSGVVSLVSLTGSNDMVRGVTEAYGGLCVSKMTRVHWSCADCEIEGLVSKVNSGGRMGTDHQVFTLDGRLVDLPRFAKAINDAFTQCLPNASQRLVVGFFLRITMHDTVAYDVNLTPNKRKVLLANEDKLAEEVHNAALKEFRIASECIEVDRPSQTRVADRRSSEMTRMTLTPISTSAITQFTFKYGNVTDLKRGREESPLALAKIDVCQLYHSAHVELAPSSGDLAVADLSSSEEEGDTMSTSSSSARAPSFLLEGGTDKASEEWVTAVPETLPLTFLSDEGNRPRDEGLQLSLTFPSWDALQATILPFGCATALSHPPTTKVDLSADSNLAQDSSVLANYFHKHSFTEMVILGQFNHGFIIASLGEELFVIDQHASDEKYNYERLMSSYVPKPQPLVVPVSVAMDAYEVDLAVDNCGSLLKHGFKVSRGADPTKLLVSSIPVLPYDVVSAVDVLELVQQLVRYGTITKGLRAVWHSMATKACRSSIMIGTALTDATMRSVVDRLSGLDQPWTCPHGRPTLRHLCNKAQLKGMAIRVFQPHVHHS